MAAAVSFPQAFEDYTRSLFGAARFARYEQSFSENIPVSIRLDPFKRIAIEEGEPIPWCADGYWLPSRRAFTTDPLFHAGCYYVQEAGSMFLDAVLRQYVTAPVTMLDLCAAPGGKSTLSRATLPSGSLLYCNDPARRRVPILVENVQKQGHPDVIVTNNYARDYARAGMTFDVILADVPCSGEGLFRRDAAAMREWSVQNVVKSAALQRSIVQDIWPCLRDEGILIYSTCTFNTHENEENISWIAQTLGATVLSVEVEQSWGICGSLLQGFSAPVYRFIPGLTRSEGLFMAVLRKTSHRAVVPHECPSALRIVYDGARARAAHNDKDVAPSQALALLHTLPHDRFPRVELSLTEALRYLRRETIVLPAVVPQGFVLVCYDGFALGFVKNIGVRANNLYPSQWRIRNK